MPTLTMPPLLRQLWPLILAIALAIVGAVALTPDTPTAAPPWLLPFALVAMVAIVGYGLHSRMSKLDRTVLMTFTALAIIAVYAGAVLAQASDPANGVVRPTESTVITIDALTLSFLVGSVMPLLTALATKLNASTTVKGVVNLVLSVLGGVLVAFQTNAGSLTLQEFAAAAIATYLSAQALYTGVLKRPALKIAAKVAPEVGIGHARAA